jgi:hypothetical protein
MFEKTHFDPFISTLGVKVDVNTVNISNLPSYFHSRHENILIRRDNYRLVVNNKKQPRRGSGSQC